MFAKAQDNSLWCALIWNKEDFGKRPVHKEIVKRQEDSLMFSHFKT